MSGDPLDLELIRKEIAETTLDREEDLERFRVRFLGRKGGIIKGLFGRVSEVAPSERKAFGQDVNALKLAVEQRGMTGRVKTVDSGHHRQDAGR